MMKKREQTERCPLCGDKFSPQGLDGHLRMGHNVDPKEVLGAGPSSEDGTDDTTWKRMDQVFHLVDRIKECREKREEIEELDRSNFMRNDLSCQEAIEQLEELERELRSKLEKIREEGPNEQPEIEGLDEAVEEAEEAVGV